MALEYKYQPLKDFKISGDGAGTLEGHCNVSGILDDGGDVVIGYDAIDDWLQTGFMAHSHDWSWIGLVGIPVDAKVDDIGLWAKAAFHSTKDAQDVRTKAMERMDAGKQVGLSIGYEVSGSPIYIYPRDYAKELPKYVKAEALDDALSLAATMPRVRVLKVAVREFSIVTSPMNRQSQAAAVKGNAAPEAKGPSGKADWPLAPRDRAWDGGAAHKRLLEWASDADGNLDQAKFKSVHFWFDGDAPENVGSYKLAFCDVIDGDVKACPKGIFACAGSHGVDAAEIPDDDKEKIRKKIEGYYAKMRNVFEDDAIIAPWKSSFLVLNAVPGSIENAGSRSSGVSIVSGREPLVRFAPDMGGRKSQPVSTVASSSEGDTVPVQPKGAQTANRPTTGVLPVISREEIGRIRNGSRIGGKSTEETSSDIDERTQYAIVEPRHASGSKSTGLLSNNMRRCLERKMVAVPFVPSSSSSIRQVPISTIVMKQEKCGVCSATSAISASATSSIVSCSSCGRLSTSHKGELYLVEEVSMPMFDVKAAFEDELAERTNSPWVLWDVFCCVLYDMLWGVSSALDAGVAVDPMAAFDASANEFIARLREWFISEVNDEMVENDMAPMAMTMAGLLGPVDAKTTVKAQGAKLTTMLSSYLDRLKGINVKRLAQGRKEGRTLGAATREQMRSSLATMQDAMDQMDTVKAAIKTVHADMSAMVDASENPDSVGITDASKADDQLYLRLKRLQLETSALI